MVSRNGQPDCIVLVKPFVRHHEVDNPLLQVVKHADLHCMEEVGLWDVAHDTGNMSKIFKSLVDIERREFGIGCLGVGITERSI